jgi:gluconokinase
MSVSREPIHVVTMGVSGTGKTSVAERLAGLLDLELIEGDNFHPPHNVTKMRSGVPLTDEDRHAWLERLRTLTVEHSISGISTVLTCSALRRSYRDILRRGVPRETFFVHLHGSFEALSRRMESREHFMPAALLRSQLDTLEPLETDEAGAVVDVSPSLEAVVAAAVSAIRARYGETMDASESSTDRR